MTPKLYIAAAILLVLAAAIGYARMQTLRLRAVTAEMQRVTEQRDAAIKANGQYAEQVERAAAVERQHQAALALLRRNYERRLAHVQKVPDDGCLDRALPADLLGVLRDGNPGAGEAFCPAGP